MGYRIVYDPDFNNKYPVGKKVSPWKWMVAVCLLILMYASSFNSKIRSLWEELLIPGDTDAMKAAISHMMDNLKAGESMGHSITTFCRDIITADGQEIEPDH